VSTEASVHRRDREAAIDLYKRLLDKLSAGRERD